VLTDIESLSSRGWFWYTLHMKNLDPNVFIVREDDSGRRIDRILRKMFPSLSLAFIFKMIRKGSVRIGGKKTRVGAQVRTGDEILVSMKALPLPREEKRISNTGRASEAIERIVVFENDGVLAIDKPFGVLVHGPESLDTLVRSYLSGARPISLSFTPGPLHRLDRNTTGIILFAKNLKASQEISLAFRNKLCTKYYVTVCRGKIIGEKYWEDRIERDKNAKRTVPAGSKDARIAVTEAIPIAYGNGLTLAICIISGGMTHQIRAQAALHGHALDGDAKYGGGRGRYYLHAAAVSFAPDTGFGLGNLLCEIPQAMQKYLNENFGSRAKEDAMRKLRMLLGGKAR
jgi:23S rRNA pseudouridine955/2504/2580 synthase